VAFKVFVSKKRKENAIAGHAAADLSCQQDVLELRRVAVLADSEQSISEKEPQRMKQ
jgi:hypothetical protein